MALGTWTVAPVQSADGSLAACLGQVNSLLNHTHPVDPNILERLPDLDQITHLDHPSQLSETHQAIKSLKNNKSPGPDSNILHFLEQESPPQDANIMDKNKGQR